MVVPPRPSTQLHPDGLADGNVLGLVGTAYGPAQVIKPVGITGATNATRYVGGTTTGHPTTGTFIAGDYVVTADGHIWVCSTGGSPGTWVDIAGSGGSGYATVQDEGTALTARTVIDFAGAGVTATDDAANSRTLVTIPGGSGGGTALAKVEYNPTTITTVTTTSTTAANIDATNLKVTFTATSSLVKVVQEAAAYVGANGQGYLWNIRDGSGDLAKTKHYVTGLGGVIIRTRATQYVTVTSGNAYTWYWGHAVNGANGTQPGNIRYGDDSTAAPTGAALFEVYAA